MFFVYLGLLAGVQLAAHNRGKWKSHLIRVITLVVWGIQIDGGLGIDSLGILV